MLILAIERELPSAPAITMDQIFRVEAACVWNLQKRGIIRAIWFTAAGRNAVIMLECSNATEARQHLAMLPLVHAGVIDFTVHELRVYDGLERLFAHRLSADFDAKVRKRGKKTRSEKPARSPTGRRGISKKVSGASSPARAHSTPALIKA